MKFAKRFLFFSITTICCAGLAYKLLLTNYKTPTSLHSFGRYGDNDYPPPNHKEGEPRTILLWTSFFGEQDYIAPLDTLGCPQPSCIITSNRSLLPQSDAVIFHLRDLALDDMPPSSYSWQKWVLLHHESPPHTPHILEPLANFINWTATYREDSDIVLSPRLVKVPHHLPPGDIAKNKTRMVAWFVSNCNTPSRREDYVKELQKTLSVDIFGSCGQKTCLPKMSNECLEKVSKEYRYYLSFENSICKDYVTEKFFLILNTNMIPVVLGGADYKRISPPNSFIDALSFESPRSLGKYLISLAKDHQKYNKYFEWRHNYSMTITHYACTLCRKLHEGQQHPTTYPNLHDWWFEDSKCKSWFPS